MSLPDPYYQDDACTIYHGDCRDILPHLEPVDLVLTDPPYRQDFAHGGGLMVGSRLKTHEQILQKVGSGAGFDITEYLPSIIKSGNCALIWCSCKQLKEILPFTGDRFNVLTWVKTNPVPLTNNKMLNDVEFCVCFLGNKFKYPKCDFNLKRTAVVMKNGQENNIDHPTVKPIKLIKQNIECFSNINDTILDPFMGSGTTLVAAKQLNRKAIGIEIEEKYCEIAVKRLAQGVIDLTSIERS